MMLEIENKVRQAKNLPALHSIMLSDAAAAPVVKTRPVEKQAGAGSKKSNNNSNNNEEKAAQAAFDEEFSIEEMD
jgi:hypothetical protein